VPSRDDIKKAKSLIAAGRLDEASRLCRRVIKRKGDPEAIYLLAVISGQTGMRAESLTLFRQALRKLPGRSDVTYNFGVILNEMGKTDEAAEQWAATLALNPGHTDALFNMGRAHADRRRWQEAADAFRRLVALQPQNLRVWLNLGNVHYRICQWDNARACYARIVEADGAHVDGWINLGMTECRDGNRDAAIRHLRQALRLEPGNVRAHINLAQALLAAGELREGYRENEWRRRVQELRFPVAGQSAWSGGSLAGKRILLYGEQGQGDIIHFLRYAPAVAERGASVRLYCHPPLTGVAKRVAGVDEAAGFGEPPPTFDCYAPLMSLPHLLDMTGVETIPPAPYVNPLPGPGLAGDNATPRIGLVWAGNPDHEDDANRSCPFDALLPLIDMANHRFFSLQVGDAGRQIGTAGVAHRIIELGASFADFGDTARALRSLDLVISVDTAVAHLAGALGRPVWLLLPRVADWRWFGDGQDTPWYPTMRLFRQTADGGWPPVIGRVQRALAEFSRRPDAKRKQPLP